MTDVPPEDLVDEPTPEQPAGQDPEEYEPDERTRAVSPDTGTVYDELGEPENTPQDVAPEDEP
jgi:hypothetical protein